MCLKLLNLSSGNVISFFVPFFFCHNRDWTFVVYRVLFGEENVSLLTGDAVVNKDSPTLNMTIEIFHNMSYQRCSSLSLTLK